MFRKILAAMLVGVLALSLAGCANKFRVEREGMPEGLKTKLEEQIKTGQEMLDAAKDDSAKATALLEIAFANQQLGYLDKAIPVYKQILDLYPQHFQSLNNLGVIYEEVGEHLTAAKYYGQLLEANPSNTEALSDAIRELIAAEHFDDAQTNLENFARYNKDSMQSLQTFVSEQFESIRQARLKSQSQQNANAK
ncbi:MAG: tetratricopeptide repeat protein [Patescibacteria group bacterium]